MVRSAADFLTTKRQQTLALNELRGGGVPRRQIKKMKKLQKQVDTFFTPERDMPNVMQMRPTDQNYADTRNRIDRMRNRLDRIAPGDAPRSQRWLDSMEGQVERAQQYLNQPIRWALRSDRGVDYRYWLRQAENLELDYNRQAQGRGRQLLTSSGRGGFPYISIAAYRRMGAGRGPGWEWR